MSEARDDNQDQTGNSLYAAIARTATRSLALYFSRPVRLFRPSKVSGWQTLQGLATHHGRSLSPRYISWLVKEQGFLVLPKHFLPPLAVNIVLGSVLWATYGEVSSALEPHISSSTMLAALSGAAAGGAQALVAAPAENVRFLLEGGSPATGWSYAWKEVFRGRPNGLSTSKAHELQEARQVREWMQEVGEMAGRGWKGWKWGLAKDVCGFAVFFSIFELTRDAAQATKAQAQELLQQKVFGEGKAERTQRHTPRVVHAITLVTGGAIAGLAYEYACRPWDAARKVVYIDRLNAAVTASKRHSVTCILSQKVKDDGWLSFFRSPIQHAHDAPTNPVRRRLHTLGRTLARVGPWGIRFLI